MHSHKKCFLYYSEGFLRPVAQKSMHPLYRSLVRSRIEYGLIAYGSTSKSKLLKLEVVTRSILRIILGSRTSTPIEILYAETGTEPIPDRRYCLGIRYFLNLNQKPCKSYLQNCKNYLPCPQRVASQMLPKSLLSQLINPRSKLVTIHTPPRSN